MWWVLSYVAGGIAVLLAYLVYLFFLRPSVIVQLFLKFWRRTSGMTVKFIGDDEYIFCYGEKGQRIPDKSSILFIHGFTSSKDQWNTAFKNLPKDYHLIALDMPGHGATTTPPLTQDISLDFTMSIIKRFVDLVGLSEQPFHIVGTSLGGCTVGLFSASYPHLVERVTMICPAMRCPEDSDFSRQMEAAIALGADNIEMEHCRLLPQTARELQLMLDSCCYAKTKFNKQILTGFMDLRCPKNLYFLRVFRAIATEENLKLLENHCHKITMPSQLIWGAHDQIIHPSGADLLKSILPNCQDVTILDNCGHTVDLDRPFAYANAIVRFRGDSPKTK